MRVRMVSLDKPSALLGLLLLLFGCTPSSVHEGPRIASTHNLHRIGIAIRDFESERGKLPDRLSELVPWQVSTNDIPIFYVRSNFTLNQQLPLNWKVTPSLIDEHSSYVYLGNNLVHDIILFERTNLWKPTATHSEQIAALFSDYHVQYVPILDLQRWLGER